LVDISPGQRKDESWARYYKKKKEERRELGKVLSKRKRKEESWARYYKKELDRCTPMGWDRRWKLSVDCFPSIYKS
jgi:hypothetical protein